MSAIRTLGVHFLQFFSGSLAGLLIGLVSFPILTRALSEADYGALSMITMATSIAVVVAKAGLSDGIIRFYREYSEDPERLRTFTSTVVVRGLLLASVVTVAFVALSPPLIRTLALDQALAPAILVMSAYLFVRPLNIIVLNYLRATGRTMFFNGVSLFMKLTSTTLSLLLLFAFGGSIAAFFAGVAGAEVLGSIALFSWLFRNYSVAIASASRPLSLQLIRFGLPLLATELGYLLLIYSDRYIIAIFNGTAAVGEYTVGYNLPAYINDLVLFSVSYAIVPIYTELYAKKGKAETQAFLARALKYYVIGLIPACAGYAAVARDIIVILASERYESSASFSPIILCGLAFMGMNYILYAGLYLEKRTNLILLTMMLTLLVNVGLNLWLVPQEGPWGAAMATLVACVFSSVLTASLSFRYLSIRLPFASITIYGATALIMLWVLLQIDLPSPWLNVAVKVPLGVLGAGAAMLISDRKEVAGVLALIRRRG